MDFAEGGAAAAMVVRSKPIKTPASEDLNNNCTGNGQKAESLNELLDDDGDPNTVFRKAFERMGDGGGFNYSLPRAARPIMSPLNSLMSRAESVEDTERNRFARELDRLGQMPDFGTNARRESGVKPLDFAETDAIIADITKAKPSDFDDIGRGMRQFAEYDTTSLCSQCLAEQMAADESNRISSLRKRLAEHVDEMNIRVMQRAEREVPEDPVSEFPRLEGLTEEELKEKERLDKLRYREELKAEIEQKREEMRYNEEKQRHADNVANTEDAKLFSEERDHQKALEILEKKRRYDELKEQIALRDSVKREEDARLEWWERRARATGGDNRGIKHEEGDQSHIMEQLRRNVALKESVEMLEDFKRQQRDNEEDLRSLHHRKLDMIHESVSTQASLIRPERGRRRSGFSQDPEVYRAWELAHQLNDRRYRVLQDTDVSSSAILPSRQRELGRLETVVQEKHCRKCHRPLRTRKSTRFIRDYY